VNAYAYSSECASGGPGTGTDCIPPNEPNDLFCAPWIAEGGQNYWPINCSFPTKSPINQPLKSPPDRD